LAAGGTVAPSSTSVGSLPAAGGGAAPSSAGVGSVPTAGGGAAPSSAGEGSVPTAGGGVALLSANGSGRPTAGGFGLVRSGQLPPWPRWSGDGGVPFYPRGASTPLPTGHSAAEAFASLCHTTAAERVHDSVDTLARYLLSQRDAYAPWRRQDPTFKPIVTGSIWTPSGPRRVSVMLDTGATHCFVCTQLAVALGLPLGSTAGPSVVSMASPGATRLLGQPVSVPLALGTTHPLLEVIDMSPLDLGSGLDIILGWDWISSHDLRFLYPQGIITGASGPDLLEATLHSARRSSG